jgi:hypothetical protein
MLGYLAAKFTSAGRKLKSLSMFVGVLETSADPSAALGMTTSVVSLLLRFKQWLGAGALFNGDGDLLYDFQAEAF